MADASPGDDAERLVAFARSLGGDPDDIDAAVASGQIGVLCIDLATRPEGEPVPFDQAAGACGLSEAEAARIWRGLGFPDPVAAETFLTPPEVATLELLGTIGAEYLGPDLSAEMARVVGGSLARVAEALVDAFRIGFEVPEMHDEGRPYGELVEEYVALSRELFPRFNEALGTVLRRHIIGVSAQMWATDEDHTTVTVDRAVGFADLVGYTAATSRLSHAELASMVDRFESQVAELVSDHGGRLVKMIGDEAMFVCDTERAAGLGQALLAEFSDDIRVGLAAGAMASTRGDYFGDVVNLAARLVRLADPGTALVSDAVREAAGDATLTGVGSLELKGFDDPVPAFVLGG